MPGTRDVPSDRTSSTSPAAAAGVPALKAALAAVTADIDDRAERMVKFRRRLHASPEASGQERATTRLSAEALGDGGLAPRIMQDEVGVIADIDLGAPSDSFIALRSELDCVAVHDDKQQPYASTQPGLCHACGHDAHSTMNLAAALVINEHLDAIRRLRPRHNLRFIFQSAEEVATGARSMIKQGALNGVRAIFAVHVEPFLDAGVVGIRKGPMTAACRTFTIHVRGRGGHSARPHQTADPIAAACLLVSEFYQLCPRSIDGRQPLALTVGSIVAGDAANAIPDDAHLKGTLRTMRLEDAETVEKRMRAICEGLSLATGCTIDMEFLHACPPTDNDSEVVDVVTKAAAELLGPQAVQPIELPSMGGEDFAFYQQVIPGAIVRLGAGLPAAQTRRSLHSSLFDIDESALPIGAKLMARVGLELALAYRGRER